MAEMTTVKVLCQEQYDAGMFDFGNWEDGSLDRVIASLQDIRDAIPKEYRASARCEIDSVGGYEDSRYARIEVTYVRPATAEEIAAEETKRKKSAERELYYATQRLEAAKKAAGL